MPDYPTCVIVSSLTDGLERGILLSGNELLPVDAGEELVSFDLIDSSWSSAESIVGVPLEETAQQTLSLGAQKLRHPQLGAENLFHRILAIFTLDERGYIS